MLMDAAALAFLSLCHCGLSVSRRHATRKACWNTLLLWFAKQMLDEGVHAGHGEGGGVDLLAKELERRG